MQRSAEVKVVFFFKKTFHPLCKVKHRVSAEVVCGSGRPSMAKNVEGEKV